MINPIIIRAMANSYTDESIEGGGAVKGKNCTIQSIVHNDDKSVVTFAWTLDGGTVTTDTMTVKDGESAYKIAVRLGYTGTEAEWLESLKGDSAYDIAVQEGYVGTRAEWIASLKGEKGDTGAGIAKAEFDADGKLVFTRDDEEGTQLPPVEMPPTKVDISKDPGNVAENRSDGLFVPKGAVEISKKDGNIIKSEADGLYAKADTIEISKAEKNILKQNEDGLYVPEVDTSNFVEKKTDYDLVSDADVAQITANKESIETLNGDATVVGSVAKQIAEALGKLNKLEKQIVETLPSVADADANAIYLVKQGETTTYDMYTLVTLSDGSKSLASMGGTEIDLDGYLKTDDAKNLYLALADVSKETLSKLTTVTETVEGVEVLHLAFNGTKLAKMSDLEGFLTEDDLEGYAKLDDETASSDTTYSSEKIEELVDGVDPSWTGTKAEFEALDKSTLKDGQQVNITDDSDKSLIDDSKTTTENVWSAKKVNDSLVDIESALDDKADKNAVLKSLEVGSGNRTAQIIPWSDGTHYRGFEDKSSNTYTDIVTKDGVANVAKIENGVMTKLAELATMDKVAEAPIYVKRGETSASNKTYNLNNLPDGVYDVSATFLYQNNDHWYKGVVTKYDGSITLKAIAGSSETIINTTTLSGTSLNFGFAFSSLRFAKFGYWD